MREDNYTIRVTCDACKPVWSWGGGYPVWDWRRRVPVTEVHGKGVGDCLTQLKDKGWYLGRKKHLCPKCAGEKK